MPRDLFEEAGIQPQQEPRDLFEESGINPSQNQQVSPEMYHRRQSEDTTGFKGDVYKRQRWACVLSVNIFQCCG